MPTQNTQFSYITLAGMRTQLAQRLNSNQNDLWSTAELNLYISEALSFWNCLTQYWPQDYPFTINPPTASNWTFTNGAGSPRQQTLTDSNIYSYLLYHLLEPQTGPSTVQYSQSDLTSSVQQNRDNLLQATAANMAVITASIPVNDIRTYLPDSTLDVRRVRYSGANSGVTVTLTRGDSNSFLRFSPKWRQSSGPPLRYDVLGDPPLALTVDSNANEPNSLELLVMNAGSVLTFPIPSPLQIPNDWAWVIKYGALADLLAKEPESADRARENYCRQRYEEGVKLMMSMPWILNGYVNNAAVETVPIIGKDRYAYEWQSKPTAWPSIVIGGIDLIAVCPVPTALTNVTLTVVGNAPQPISDTAFIQAPRDVIEVLTDYAQHLAVLKQGGSTFQSSMPLYQNIINYAIETSLRLRESGIFATDLRPPVSKQDLEMPRFAVKGA